MRLFIVRHGQTIENQQNICQGQTDGHLSAKGIGQARLLARRLADKDIDAIYTSDLKRAADTAKEIAAKHPKAVLKKDTRLRERYLAHMEGRPFPPGWDWKSLPEGVETDREMYDRVKGFIADIQGRHKAAVIVTHGGTKRAFFTLLHSLPASSFGQWDEVSNTGLSEFVLKNGRFRAQSLNSTSHLD